MVGPPGDCVNWRERCLILEESLSRFRQQASKIRNTLGQKVRMFTCWLEVGVGDTEGEREEGREGGKEGGREGGRERERERERCRNYLAVNI